jgi:hypothetical protein
MLLLLGHEERAREHHDVWCGEIVVRKFVV